MGLPEFWEQMCHSPMLMVSTVLTLGVILVNGWTDAPNAIATCVSTRSMSPRSAILMAAVFNFLGVLVMTMFNKTVAETIYNMAASEDKTIAFVEGATHKFTPAKHLEKFPGQFGDTMKTLHDFVDEWLSAGRF